MKRHCARFFKDPLLTMANHFTSLIFGFLSLILIAAFVFSMVEPVGFGDGVYWAITTATTTGYGDISPETVAGKITANTLQVSGLILGAFLVAHILERLRPNEHVNTDAEQDWLAESIRLIAYDRDVIIPAYPDSTKEK